MPSASPAAGHALATPNQRLQQRIAKGFQAPFSCKRSPFLCESLTFAFSLPALDTSSKAFAQCSSQPSMIRLSNSFNEMGIGHKEAQRNDLNRECGSSEPFPPGI